MVRARHTVSRVLLFFFLCVALAGAACRDEGDILIDSLRFEGVSQVDRNALAAALQTRKGSRLPWGQKRYFDRRAFDADLKRIEAFYRDRGFPDARISSFDVKLNAAQDKVDITLRITEGQPVIVEGIDVTGVNVLSNSTERSLRSGLPLRVGHPLDRQLAAATRDSVIGALRDEGYAYADATMMEREVGPRRVRLQVAATPGIITHFGPVEIVGVKTVSETVVSRQLTYAPGDLFTRKEMRESQRKLYRLELFEFVNVDTQENRAQPVPDVPTRVTVGEGKHRKITFGLGYGTEEQARARVRWDHLNVLGGAQHGGVEAKWSSLDRGVRTEYREPYFLSSHFSLNFDGQAWQGSEPVYSLNQFGGRVTLRHQDTSEMYWSLSLANEYQRSRITEAALQDLSSRDELIALGLDPRTGESRGTVGAVALDINRNTTVSLLDARSGYVLTGHVEQAGKWLWGSFNYWSVGAEARHYVLVGGKVVLANRIRMATIDPVGDIEANIPFYKRFFLGGASSIRGWGRFEVSPLISGLPIGGLSALEGSSEVRMPISGKFSGVVFLDYGNVWSNPWDFKIGDLRMAVGPGLRYLTPVGPARLDIGYQMTPINGLLVNGSPEGRHWRVHFSIGQAF